jgi:alanine dehydrogenase
MKIGIPKETKIKENRVSCAPGGARMLVQQGHEVFVQQGAGIGSGFPEETYREAGASVVPGAAPNLGAERALELMPDLRLGLNTYQGKLVHPAVAEALRLPCAPNPFHAGLSL